MTDARFPYYQALNLHRYNTVVRDIAISKTMGQYAAALLQEQEIRLYQTAAFEKNDQTLNMATGWHQVKIHFI